MLGWLGRLVGSFLGLVPGPVRQLVQWAVHGIASVMGTVFHDVTSAWDDLVTTARAIEEGAWHLGRSVWRQFNRVLTYWIPHFAMVGWWWVTHPDQLALVLFWWVIKYLEQFAWDAGKYLGDFFLSLFVHNFRRFASLLEDILVAIL